MLSLNIQVADVHSHPTGTINDPPNTTATILCARVSHIRNGSFSVQGGSSVSQLQRCKTISGPFGKREL